MKKRYIVFLIVSICFSGILRAQNNYDTPEKALKLIDQGKFDEARTELNQNRKKQPDNPLILFYLAQIEDDYDRALWMYKEIELLADSTLAAKALYHRAEKVFSRGNLPEAEILFEELLNKYSGNSFTGDAWYRLGVIALTNEDPDKGLTYFTGSRDTTANDETRLLAAAGIMECYVALADWEKALESALDTLKEKDDMSVVTPRILEVIALSWRNMGNDENAGKFTERLLSNYPYSYQVHVIREEAKKFMDENEYLMGPSVDDSYANEYTSAITSDEETGDAKFSVQASAFTDRNNALRLLRTLQDKGFDARVDMKTVGDTHFFVIRVGFFTSREDAERMVERVTSVTGIKANVVILN